MDDSLRPVELLKTFVTHTKNPPFPWLKRDHPVISAISNFGKKLIEYRGGRSVEDAIARISPSLDAKTYRAWEAGKEEPPFDEQVGILKSLSGRGHRHGVRKVSPKTFDGNKSNGELARAHQFTPAELRRLRTIYGPAALKSLQQRVFEIAKVAQKLDWSKGNQELAREVGIATVTLARLRKKVAPETINKPCRWNDADWSKSDSALAKEFQVQLAIVRKRRLKLFPEQRRSKWAAVDWSKSDTEIAKEFQVRLVEVRRRRLLIFPEQRRTKWPRTRQQ